MLFKLQKNEFENQAAHLHWILCSALENAQRGNCVTEKWAVRGKCASNSSIKKWHKEFKDSQKSVHNAPQCGRPRTLVTEINTKTVASIIKDDRHLSNRISTSLLNMLKMSVKRILTQELKMKQWVPHLFTWEQMGLRLWLAEENLKKLQDLDYRYCEGAIIVDES